MKCPRCKTPCSASTRNATGGTTYRQFKCQSCGLVFNTQELLVRNQAIERQLSVAELERIFGKPKFKYKAVRLKPAG